MTKERIAEKAYAYLKTLRGHELQRVAESNGIVAVWDDDKAGVLPLSLPNTSHVSFCEIALWMMGALDKADYDISRLYHQIEMLQRDNEHLKMCLSPR